MKLLYVIALFMTSNFIFSQSYLPIPDSNAVWIQGQFLYFAYNNHEHATITQPLSYGNDTLINGDVYHTLHGHAYADWIDGWGSQQNYQEGTDFISDETRVVFRQDVANKFVYQWDNVTNQEHILYDFGNLVVGQPYPETFNNMDYPQILVMAYDSIMLNDGLYHERWTLGSNSNDSGFVSIIEGVGSSMGFNLPIQIPFEQSSATLCFSKDGNVVFDGWANANGLISPRYSESCASNLNVKDNTKKGVEINIWPVPAEDRINISSNERIELLILFDIMGNQILQMQVDKLTDAEISLKEIPRGNYILKVYTINNNISVKRVVK